MSTVVGIKFMRNCELMPKLTSLAGKTLGRYIVFRSTKARNMTTTTNNNLNGAISQQNVIDLCKANAARTAVDQNVNFDCSHQVIGIGSGSTMRYVLERLRERSLKNPELAIKCIPSSFQSKQLIYDYGLPIGELQEHPIIDVTIDGADEVDENFVAIKGGGACLAQEKVIAFVAKKFVVVADYRKDSKHLCQNWTKGIPIEVLPMACNAVCNHIASKFNVNLSDLTIRIGKEKAGPVITDNGNFVVDWKYNRDTQGDKTLAEWKNVSDEIRLIPGVVETGIFAGMIQAAYFGQENGSVLKKSPSNGLKM